MFVASSAHSPFRAPFPPWKAERPREHFRIKRENARRPHGQLPSVRLATASPSIDDRRLDYHFPAARSTSGTTARVKGTAWFRRRAARSPECRRRRNWARRRWFRAIAPRGFRRAGRSGRGNRYSSSSGGGSFARERYSFSLVSFCAESRSAIPFTRTTSTLSLNSRAVAIS